MSTVQEPVPQPSASVNVSFALPTSQSAPVSISVSCSSTSSRESSPVSINVSITLSPSSRRNRELATQPDIQLDTQPDTQLDAQLDTQPAWQPPTLEEFLADIRHRQSGPAFPRWDNPFSVTNHLAETGQENDPPESIIARDMALDTTGMFADCTPIMAWNAQFGNKEAYYHERFRQAQARHPFIRPSTESKLLTASNLPSQRPKRAAAKEAPAVWEGLHPQKRQQRK
jgi:hypothetical protein